MFGQRRAAQSDDQGAGHGGGGALYTLRVWLAHTAGLTASVIPGLLSIWLNPAGVSTGYAGLSGFIVLVCAISVVVFVKSLRAAHYSTLLLCCTVCVGCLYFTVPNAFANRAETVERAGVRRVDAEAVRDQIKRLAARAAAAGEQLGWATPESVSQEIKEKQISIIFSRTEKCSIDPSRMVQLSRVYCAELASLGRKLADASNLVAVNLELNGKRAELKETGGDGGDENPTVRAMSSFFGMSEENAKRWQIGALPVALVVCETFGAAVVTILLMPPAPLPRAPRQPAPASPAPEDEPDVTLQVNASADPESFALEFLAARLPAQSGLNVLTTEVHEAYERHCRSAGQAPLMIAKFTPLAVKAGYAKDRVRGVGTCFLNVKLLPAARPAVLKGN